MNNTIRTLNLMSVLWLLCFFNVPTFAQTAFSFLSLDLEVTDNQCIGTFEIKFETLGDLYLMERSKDGISFEQVGDWIECNGNTDWNMYQCIDTAPYPGVSFYRIRHIALTEDRYNFSESFQVVNMAKNQLLIARPNPFEEEFVVEFISTPYPHSYIQIVNSVGQTIHSEYIPDNTITVPISFYTQPAGLYFIWVIQNGKRRLAQKMIKM